MNYKDIHQRHDVRKLPGLVSARKSLFLRVGENAWRRVTQYEKRRAGGGWNGGAYVFDFMDAPGWPVVARTNQELILLKEVGSLYTPRGDRRIWCTLGGFISATGIAVILWEGEISLDDGDVGEPPVLDDEAEAAP